MSTGLLSVAEVATVLRKSPRYVLDELKRRNLRGAKFGGEWHIQPADVDAYIQARMNVRRVAR